MEPHFINIVHQIVYLSIWHGQITISVVFSCDQAALWMIFSVCPSVCLSVCPSHISDYHRIIMKFSGVITKDQGNVYSKGQGQRSKVKVTTQLSRFLTVTPVWIHIWWRNDTYSLMLLRRGALFFSRSSVKFQGHTALQIVEFDPDWTFPDCNSSLNSPMAMKCSTKLKVAWERCPIVFQGNPSNIKVTRI